MFNLYVYTELNRLRHAELIAEGERSRLLAQLQAAPEQPLAARRMSRWLILVVAFIAGLFYFGTTSAHAQGSSTCRDEGNVTICSDETGVQYV
jgi:hypothetical protein